MKLFANRGSQIIIKMPNPLDELPGTVKERKRITPDDISDDSDEDFSLALLKKGRVRPLLCCTKRQHTLVLILLRE